jgi:hypothetical protein
MKSLDTAIKSFELVYKNPKIMLVPLAIIGLSFIFLFAIGLFVSINIINIIFGKLNAIDALSNLSTPFLVILALVLLYLVILFLISPLITGMLISSGIQALEGKLSLSKAFEEAKKKYLSLLGVFLITIGIFILVFVVPLIFIMLVGMVSKLLLSILVILYMLFIIGASIFLVASVFEANTLVFTENKNAVEAVKRSFYIGRQKVISIIASQTFLIIMVFGISLLIEIFGLIFALVDKAMFLPVFSILFFIFVRIPFYCFTSSASAILPVVFYYNYNLKNL